VEKKQTQAIVLGVIAVIAGVVLFYQFVIVPGKAGGPAGKGTVVDVKAQLMKDEMLIKSMPQQKAEVELLERRIAEYSKEIPSESDNTWLSKQINRIAGRTGVRDVSQKFLPAYQPELKLTGALGDRYAVKAWEMRMRCGYHELGNFLNALENINRFLEIKSIDIEGNEPDGQEALLLITYLVGKEKEPGK